MEVEHNAFFLLTVSDQITRQQREYGNTQNEDGRHKADEKIRSPECLEKNLQKGRFHDHRETKPPEEFDQSHARGILLKIFVFYCIHKY